MSGKKIFCLSVLGVCGALLVAFEFLGLEGLGIILPPLKDELLGMTLTRGLGGIAFLTLLWYLGFDVLIPRKNRVLKNIVFCIPCFLVVINNLHIYTLLRGAERVTGSIGMIALLALECFCISLFEEMAFRGVIFLSVLEKRRGNTLDVFLSIVISSVIFGLIHAVNLFTSSPAAVIMQIGYSFLIGGMCAVVLIKTADIWLCVILHALFDFCGALVPKLGTGFVWDTPTVIITAVLSVLTAAYIIVSLLKFDVHSLNEIFLKTRKKQ